MTLTVLKEVQGRRVEEACWNRLKRDREVRKWRARACVRALTLFLRLCYKEEKSRAGLEREVGSRCEGTLGVLWSREESSGLCKGDVGQSGEVPFKGLKISWRGRGPTHP